MGDLLSLLGDDTVPAAEGPAAKKAAARRKKPEDSAAPLLDPPMGSPQVSESPATSTFTSALPTLTDLAAIRERALDILQAIDADAAGQIPESLDFPPEDDPFGRSGDEWEALWYGSRESALRVYLNMRVEFRRHLERAAAGDPHDLKPWTYWVFNGKRPVEGEPVYGLSDERRTELGWNYPGPAADFRIYRESPDE